MEILQRAECLFGSHSFVSPSHIITSQQRFIPGRKGNGARIDRRVHANTCDASCNFPNGSLPTTNNSCSSHKTMSRRDGSKRRRGVTAAPFYLGLKAAGNYEADFAVFPQPNMRHLLRQEHAVTSEPFPFSFFDEGGGNI